MYEVTVEHFGGASIEHPCKDGLWSDPATTFFVEADDEEAAEKAAREMLAAAVARRGTCRCHRKLRVGSRWWDSIGFIVKPV